MPSQLTPAQIYQYALGAGFPPETAVKMVAIALRESSGVPTAFNGKEPDFSYGLWQINMINKPGYALGAERLAQFGLSSADQLFDPVVNARAAYILWGGRESNLAKHWYIDRYGDKYQYAERYNSFLPVAYAAAGEVLSPDTYAALQPPVVGSDEGTDYGFMDAVGNLDTPTKIAAGAGIAALVWVAMR